MGLAAGLTLMLTCVLCLSMWPRQRGLEVVGMAINAGGVAVGHSLVHISFDHEETIGVGPRPPRDNGGGHVMVRRSESWSPDDLGGANDDWDVHWDTPTQRPLAAPPAVHMGTIDEDYPGGEVIDKRRKSKKPSLLSNTRAVAGIAGGAIFLVVNIFVCFMCCLRKKGCAWLCPCLNPKKRGRGMVKKYVAGAEVHEDGRVTYHELTEEEQEAAQNVGMEFAGF